MKDPFKESASSWDSPMKIEMSNHFIKAFKDYVGRRGFDRGIEIGCGTGLAGLQLLNQVDHLIMVDQSEAMLEQLKKKLNDQNRNKITIHHGQFDEIEQTADLIFTLMALHHIDDTLLFLNHVARRLETGGYFVVGDLVSEDGSFHQNLKVPHNGFDIESLTQQCRDAGLNVVFTDIYHSVKREFSNGTTRAYPQFILIAEKIS